MEQKDIDVYEILKDVPKGTEFYTSLCGNVGLAYLESNKEAGEAIWTKNKDGEYSFNKNGRWMKGGEVTFFPSKQMRDWSKFFKKGDVLEYAGDDEGLQGSCTFEKFEDETKTRFLGRYVKEKEALYSKRPSSLRTADWVKSDDPADYIRFVEERLGGKLNRETLEIEKQLEFKDGDIVALVVRKCTHIAIFQSRQEAYIGFHAVLCQNDELLLEEPFREDVGDIELRLATDSEKQQLFDALAKEGKAWDAEKKQIVDLKPAFEIGKLYVFDEEDEDGKVMVIGKLIAKNESEDTLTFGNQYEIETEKFVTDQAFDLDISLHEVLREATENEVELFNKHCAIWEKKEKEAMEQPAFKPFEKVLVRNGKKCKWLPAFFILDRGEEMAWRYSVLPLRSGKTADFIHCIPYEGNENITFTDYDIENLPF